MTRTFAKLTKWLSHKSSAVLAGIVVLGFIFVGCDGSGSHMTEGSGDYSYDVNSGMFIDSPVEGLFYQTPSQSGMTDKGGTFTYMDGEVVAFYIGDLRLGETEGKPAVTPVDLVSGAVDETNPAVTNICRMLQTLDIDEDPENGITITPDTSDMITIHSMEFMMDGDDFEHHENMIALMDSLMDVAGFENGRTMVSSEQAQRHFRDTMENMGLMHDDMMSDDGDSDHDGSMMDDEDMMADDDSGHDGFMMDTDSMTDHMNNHS